MLADIINTLFACINKSQQVLFYLYLLSVACAVYSQSQNKIVLCLMTIVSSSASFAPVSGAQHGSVLITFPSILLRCKKKKCNTLTLSSWAFWESTHPLTNIFLIGDVSLFGRGPIVWFYQDLQEPVIISRGILTTRHRPFLCVISVYSLQHFSSCGFSLWKLLTWSKEHEEMLARC